MSEIPWTTDELHRAATLYYVQDETMQSIATRFGVSRSTVSRQLKEARDRGIVRITMLDLAATGDVAQELSERFGVRVNVVSVRETASDGHRLRQVARVAGRMLSEWFTSNMTMGVAWGTTMSAVMDNLVPKPTRGSRIVQLNGAVHSSRTETLFVADLLARACDAFEARPVFFPVPAFFDEPATRAAVWRERSISHVVELQRSCDLAVFGVGTWKGGITSQVYAGGFLGDDDMAALHAARAVGDVCTTFLREDGTYSDIPLNARATGPTPAELGRMPRRLCVVAGASRVPILVGALRAGAVTDVVVDEQTALATLARVRAGGGRHHRRPTQE